MFMVMLKNGWTTFLGFLSGFVYYLSTNGATFPTNKQEWVNLLMAATLAGLGFVAKSATVGSQPK